MLPPQIQDFITIFLGIFVEALPFVILGSVVAALFTLFVNERWLLKIMPKNRVFSHMLMPLVGVVFPVCECGNVPVAKRLFYKGLKTSHVLTFLLAAPAFNPIVFLSTFTAFRATPEVIFFRFILTYLIAVIIGILVSYKKDDSEFLTKSFAHDVACYVPEKKTTWQRFLSLVLDDFGFMISGLVIGAIIASGLQNFTPVNLLRDLGNNPILSILVMMTIAFVISICSNVDAFVALSYASRFTTGSVVAFLVFGPMIDVKSLSMLSRVFSKKFLFSIAVIVFLLIFASTLFLNFYIL